MASNPASAADIEARWRPLSTQETTNAETFLGDAWAILKNRIPDLEARLDSAAQDPQLVIAAECAMVLRVMRNPDGKSQEAIDDYSWTRDQAVSSGLLYVLPDELRGLMPSGSTTRSRRLVAYGETGSTSFWTAPT